MESSTKKAKHQEGHRKNFPTTNPGLPISDNKTSLPTATPGSWKILYTRKNHPRPQWTARNYQSRFSHQRSAGQRRNPARPLRNFLQPLFSSSLVLPANTDHK